MKRQIALLLAALAAFAALSLAGCKDNNDHSSDDISFPEANVPFDPSWENPDA